MTVGTILPTTITQSAASPQDRKLVDGAHEFEAMLLGEMLKPLKFGQAESSDTDDNDSGADTVRSLGTEAMSKAIAVVGGLGIAREVLAEVRAERDRHGGNGSAAKV